MANNIGWGEGACNNDISWGIAQEYFSCSGSGEAPVGATLMKTGQTTSYRTGDDGDLEAGRATSFTVLASNNPFGNTNRFTDELGGTTYTNKIAIDWSTYNGTTVNGYYYGEISGTNRTWNDAIDWALALSISTYTSGWRLINIAEATSLINYSTSYALNYAPFSQNVVVGYWTSTTFISLTTWAFRLSNADFVFAPIAKTNSIKCIAARTFTVTGTTLT